MHLMDNPQHKEAVEEDSANYVSPSFGSQNFLKAKPSSFSGQELYGLMV